VKSIFAELSLDKSLQDSIKILDGVLTDNNAQSPALLKGLYGSSPSLLLAAWFRAHSRTAVIVTPSRDIALQLADDLESWLGPEDVVYLPQQEVMAFDRNSPDRELVGACLQGLDTLRGDRPALVVTALYGFRQRVMSPARLSAASTRIGVDDVLDRDAFCRRLVSAGYESTGVVARTGDYARRGSLIDIFPPGEFPLRVEFFDDQVMSLRQFDPATQRSVQKIDATTILPVSHIFFDDDSELAALSVVEELLADAQITADEADEFNERIEERIHSAGIEAWLPIFGQTVPMIDYLPPETPLLWLDPQQLSSQSRLLDDEIPRMRQTRARQEAWLPDVSAHLVDQEDLAALPNPQLWLSENWVPQADTERWLAREPGEVKDFATRRPTVQGGDVQQLCRVLRGLEDDGFLALMLCDNKGQADRLSDLVMEQDGPVPSRLPMIGHLSQGFIWPDAKLALVTDHEFFERYRRPARSRFHGAAVVKDSGNLVPGEHVVHVEYGIGLYRGLRHLTVESTDRECLLLEYEGRDKVYVPVENISLVERYSSDRDASPQLSRLGTASWSRVTKRARKAIQAMAAELLALYAERSSRPGFAFPPDGDLTRSLEESFIHTETPDQLDAIADVKKDMEKKQPMDRLICGDVGYGKTEVAMRAAFKAVEGGRQVAVLCPTTLLAHQHGETFAERFRDFPAKVAVISRFQSKSEQKEIAARIRDGRVDVLIGTHRLLSRDLRFGNLGLLVVDEEHRFGVRHKERLKQLRKEVDVLTLSATPIPRTLYMSLMGARDMSLITTPPRDRQPIHTEITAFNETVLTEAIMRELHRGGQVFFVHNRVETIQAMAAQISRLLPNINVRVAHGQMKENELERVMTDFLAQKFDVLVTTTIIESGLDMPRVNTIIIDRADRFGLAQLYQIRGRVGRSSQRAFAYLMTPPGEMITPDARRRLSALQEFQALGSGYHIAMRDLEIRGAGNILGQKQHGHLEAIGFDLYCRLLDEAISELKGGGTARVLDVRVDLHLPAYLPDEYIGDPEQKMDLYRRLAHMQEEIGYTYLREEINDRFGPLPEPAANLLDIYRIRLLAALNGIEEIRLDRAGLSFFFAGGKEPSSLIIRGLMGTGPKGLMFKAVDQFVMKVPVEKADASRAAYTLLDLLDRLRRETP
jgi:transcription-repair coupling factor (superfamily II helicase)